MQLDQAAPGIARRPAVALLVDPVVIAAVSASVAALSVALFGVGLIGLLPAVALLAGWSSAWSP